jgi:P-type conjugative transfer protein TrbG
MKKLLMTVLCCSFSCAYAQPAVPFEVPALEIEPVKLVEPTNATSTPTEKPSATLAPAPTPSLPATSQPSLTIAKTSRNNDEINGYKYPPARKAAEKSTRWANSNKAMVSMSHGGRVDVIFGQSVPKIGCAYLRVCSVELEAGETVNKVDAGDPVRWSITPSIVGEGANRTVHVIIKPKSDEPGLFTNVKIATNRRMYDIDIFSVNSAENFVRRIGFIYPENDQREWEAQRKAMAKEESLVTAQLPAMSVDKLNFNYAIEGDHPHRPVRVFDDSDKTYVQMGADFRTQEAPVLVLIGEDGKEQLVNYRLKNGYYIVDKIFAKAAMIIGVGGDQKKVTITRGCAKRTFFGNCSE